MDSVNNAVSGEFDPGRVGATVSPEPQADSSRKRISGPNVTPAGPGSNSPNDREAGADEAHPPPVCTL
jgi:hypothetical protein